MPPSPHPTSQLTDHMIDLYREKVAERYDFAVLRSHVPIPEIISPADIAAVRVYFLEYIYPNAAERARVDAAFVTLKDFLTKPSKIWRLLGNALSAVLKFGRLFPLALKTGYKSLQSYIDAKGFERHLGASAAEMRLRIPVPNEQFMLCLATIPRAEAESFVDDVLALLDSLANSQLLDKTLEILDGVVEKMRAFPNIYSHDDIDGILLGKSIIDNGARLFGRFSPQQKQAIIQIVGTNERNFLSRVYQNGNR